MRFRYVFLLSLLPFLTSCLLPDLPTLPSRPPSPSPSPSPQDTDPNEPPPPAASSTPTPTGPVEPETCQRDLSRPQPKLGKSQRRYALTMLISAAAVGIASLLYSGAYAWVPRKRHAGFRVILIIIARLLIMAAVRVSAALISSITKESPGDSALDASGATLTWGSAIFARLYHEGIMMTMTGIGFAHKRSAWVHKLREFLSERQRSSRNVDYSEEQYRSALTPPAVHPDVESDIKETSDSRNRVSVWTRMFGGRWEKKLLLLVVTLYFVGEVAVMILAVLSLVGSFRSDNGFFFIPDDEAGQCPISGDDIADMCLILFLQLLFALTNQPSLVPLLTICTLGPRRRSKGARNLVVRWLACLVLVAWVISLLVLPHLQGIMEPLFITGDLSLFWFIVISPPPYSSTSYIITAVYSCIAAAAGFVLILRIAQNDRRKKLQRVLEEKK